LAAVTAALGSTHEDAIVLRANLGFNLLEQERYVQARTYLEDAWRDMRATFGAAHPKTLVMLLNLAIANLHLGERALARTQLAEVLEARTLMLGDDDVAVANVKALLAQTAAADMNHAEALRWYDEAKRVYDRKLGNHWRAALLDARRAL